MYIYIKIWFSFLVDYEYYNECVNVFQWFLFLFSTLHFQLRNYLLTYFTRSRTFVFSLYDWSHLYSLNTFSLFSRHRLHYVNWLALLFPSENSFWCMSFAGNSYNNDDEKYRMKRNITIPDLCQQSNNNVIVYIHTHLISLSFTSSILFFHPFFFSLLHIFTPVFYLKCLPMRMKNILSGQQQECSFLIIIAICVLWREYEYVCVSVCMMCMCVCK